MTQGNDHGPPQIPTEAAHVADYVRRQMQCEVRTTPVRVDEAWPPVWRVEITPDLARWTVPPPAFVYAVSEPGMNAYRNDAQRPLPWKPVEEQNQADVVDYLRSFHLGLCQRLMGRAEHDGKAD